MKPRLPRSDESRWSLLVLAAAVAGLVLSLATPPTAIAVPLAVAFVALGPGGAVRLWVPMPRALTAVSVPLTGLAVLILGAAAMAIVDWWQPRLLAAVLAGAAAVAVLVHSSIALPHARRAARGIPADARAAGEGGP